MSRTVGLLLRNFFALLPLEGFLLMKYKIFDRVKKQCYYKRYQ